MQNQNPLRVLIHAPTASAVTRARSNAVNLLAAAPESEVRILVNAEGVTALLDSPRPETDVLTPVGANPLRRLGRTVDAPLDTVPASILTIAQMQHEFVALPRRWVVERSFGWMMKRQRLVRDYEKRIDVSEQLICVAMSSLILQRLFDQN